MEQQQILFLPENPQAPKTTEKNRHNRIMNKFKDCVFTKLAAATAAINPSHTISPQVKSRIEQALHQLFPNFDTPSHPPYASMIETAIGELKEENSSEAAISAFIQREYKGLPCGHEVFLSHHLRKLCRTGSILRAEDGRYVLLVENFDSMDMEERSSKRQRSRDGLSGVIDRDSLEKQSEVVSSISHKWVIEEQSQSERLRFKVSRGLNGSEMRLVENPREAFHNKVESSARRISELFCAESNQREAEESKMIEEHIQVEELENKVLDELYEEGEHARGVIEEHRLQGQQILVFEDSKKTKVRGKEQAFNEPNEMFEEQSKVKRWMSGCHDPSCAVELANLKEKRDFLEMEFNNLEKDQALPTTQNFVVSDWNLDHDHSSVLFKEMCMDSVKKTKTFREQLLKFSVFLWGVQVPKDGNLGSMVQVKREGALEEQRQLQKWENSVIREQSQPQEQKIDTRAKMHSCYDGEGDGVVNFRAPFGGSSLPVLANKKQEEWPRRRSPCQQREFLIVCGLTAQKRPREKISGRSPKLTPPPLKGKST